MAARAGRASDQSVVQALARVTRCAATGAGSVARGAKHATFSVSVSCSGIAVATIAVDALGSENVVGLSMPSRYSSEGSVTDSEFLAENLGIELLNNMFEKTYEEHFGRAIEGLQIEVVGWSVKVTSPKPEIEKTHIVDSKNMVTSNLKRSIYDPIQGSEVDASVFHRENLNPGDCVIGPAIIVENQTTTWISSEKQSSVQLDDCLLVTKRSEASR